MRSSLSSICLICFMTWSVSSVDIVGSTSNVSSSSNTTECPSSCIKVCPENVTAVNVEAKSVTLQWKPNNLTSVTGYRITYQSVCGERTVDMDGRGVSTRKIDDLRPHTRYTVYVRALCNGSVPVLDCNGTTFNTISKVPVVPSRVVADIRNGTSVLLSWQPLDHCSWNGHPIMYKVYVVELASGYRESHKINSSFHSVTLLPKAGRTYNVSISGVNNVGEGSRSTPVTFKIPEVCDQFFFCNTYSYYVVAGGGALLIALLATCVVLLCKKTCCRRKVTYCRDIKDRQVSLSTLKRAEHGIRNINLDDIDSMTDVNSEMQEVDDEVDDMRHQYQHQREPVYNNGWVFNSNHVAQSQMDSQYATLDSIGKSSCSSLSSMSQEEEHSTMSSLPRRRDEVVPEQRVAYPYEVPSRKGSSEIQHIYQSVDEAADDVLPFRIHANQKSHSVNTLPSSIPSSTSTSRESSVEPRFATLGPRVGGDGGYSLPPLPEYSPPPLRRSTLDLMERLREESDPYNSSQAPLSTSSHYRASGRGGSVPDILDIHSPLCLSDDSLANHGPTQTPPPNFYYESTPQWMPSARI